LCSSSDFYVYLQLQLVEFMLSSVRKNFRLDNLNMFSSRYSYVQTRRNCVNLRDPQ
jgi:hypothetical protein